MNSNFPSIIRYLVEDWNRQGQRPTMLVIVKLLYLLDLYTAKETGKTLTGWQWKFHHFGPWASESYLAVQDAVKREAILASVHESQFNEKNDYCTFAVNNEAKEFPRFKPPTRVSIELYKIIKSVGFDNRRLLNHVYHETEPMEHASPNEILSFEGLSWFDEVSSQTSILKLSKSKVKAAREALAKLNVGIGRVQSMAPIFDEIYHQGVSALDALESADVSMDGRACVKQLFKK